MSTEWDRDVRSFFNILVRERSEQLSVHGAANTIGTDRALLDASITLADETEKARRARKERVEFTINQEFNFGDPDKVARGEFTADFTKARGGPT